MATTLRLGLLAIAGCLACATIAAAAEKPAAAKAPPKIAAPMLFNTPEADAVLGAMQVFPPTSAWREDITKRPVLADSAKMIANIGADKHLAYNLDMCFVIVPPDQPKVAVKLLDYPDESEPGPYPVPANGTIEGWPVDDADLAHIQRVGKGDRHLLVVDPWNGLLYEFWQARMTDAGWQASNQATFDLGSNKMRPKGWTSGDAAGLPIFPAVPRFDECERGMVEHALRFTIRKSRKEFIYPATHHAGSSSDKAVAAMGQRLRLKPDTDISAFPKHAKAIALALMKYGMFVADNGGDWRISVAPDRRITGLQALTRLKGSDFEVIETTGEHEGPRAGK